MNLEIVEFYPNLDKKIAALGTMHVYLTDLDIDIRGVFVKKKGRHWFFGIPHQFAKEQGEKGKKTPYPIFSFTSIEKNKEFRKLLTEKGKEFIINNNFYTETQNKELPNEPGRIRARTASKFQSPHRRK